MNSILIVLLNVMIVAALANYKNRNPFLWVVIVTFTNIFGLIALIVLPKKDVNAYQTRVINFREVQENRKERLVLNLVQLLAKLCKSDQVVTKNELDVVEQFLKVNLGLEGDALNSAKRLFNETKRSEVSFMTYAYQIKTLVYNKNDLLSIIEVMYAVANTDGVADEEAKMIDETAKIFGVYGDARYHDIKMKYVTNKNDLKKYYEILGCEMGATEAEIKRCYHKQMVAYHPDKFESSDASEAEKETAYNKTLEIREAYDAIMKNIKVSV